MQAMLRGTLLAALSVLALAGAGCGVGGSNDSSGTPPPSTVVPPLAVPGPLPVGCSNVAQDFSRLGPGETAEYYWEGSPSDSGAPRYLTALLTDPGDTLSVTVSAPNDHSLFGSFAGQRIPFV